MAPPRARMTNDRSTGVAVKTDHTSEPNRPIVLRLAALMLEPTNSLNPVTSPPLIIETYHEDQLCVTVYDPTARVRSVPLSDLLSYQVVGVHFKRSSTVQLICPKLLQRFAALRIPKTVLSHSSMAAVALSMSSLRPLKLGLTPFLLLKMTPVPVQLSPKSKDGHWMAPYGLMINVAPTHFTLRMYGP